MSKKLKVVSLFSGIGAFEKGLTNLGIPFDLNGFSEIDKYAIESYCGIHSVDGSFNLGSVTDVDGSKLGEIDLLTHGSPCQSFSVAGKEEGGDEGTGTKSSLMWETVRIVSESLPKVVIWENVKSVLNIKHKHNFDRYIEELDALGYKSYYSPINSRDYNVAQNRPRLFVVSLLNSNEQFNFPQTVKLEKTIRDYLEETVDEKYIVPDHMLINYSKDKLFSRRLEVRPHDTYAYCLIAKDGRAAKTNNYVFNDLSNYDTTNYDKFDIAQMMEDGVKIRSLTPLECFRLQGFSDEDFKNAKNRLNEVFHKGADKANAQLYKQAGNSITVNVVEAILKELFINNK